MEGQLSRAGTTNCVCWCFVSFDFVSWLLCSWTSRSQNVQVSQPQFLLAMKDEVSKL